MIDPLTLRLVALRVVQDDDAGPLQQGHQLVVEGGVLLVDQPVSFCGDGLHIGIADAGIGQPRGFQIVGEAHFEELVDVR